MLGKVLELLTKRWAHQYRQAFGVQYLILSTSHISWPAPTR